MDSVESGVITEVAREFPNQFQPLYAAAGCSKNDARADPTAETTRPTHTFGKKRQPGPSTSMLGPAATYATSSASEPMGWLWSRRPRPSGTTASRCVGSDASSGGSTSSSSPPHLLSTGHAVNRRAHLGVTLSWADRKCWGNRRPPGIYDASRLSFSPLFRASEIPIRPALPFVYFEKTLVGPGRVPLGSLDRIARTIRPPPNSPRCSGR